MEQRETLKEGPKFHICGARNSHMLPCGCEFSEMVIAATRHTKVYRSAANCIHFEIKQLIKRPTTCSMTNLQGLDEIKVAKALHIVALMYFLIDRSRSASLRWMEQLNLTKLD